jgi:hypothetical protein
MVAELERMAQANSSPTSTVALIGGSTPASWSHSSVSTFGVRYTPPVPDLSPSHSIEALVEGSDMSLLREGPCWHHPTDFSDGVLTCIFLSFRQSDDTRVCMEPSRRPPRALRGLSRGWDGRRAFHQEKYVVSGDGARAARGRRGVRGRALRGGSDERAPVCAPAGVQPAEARWRRCALVGKEGFEFELLFYFYNWLFLPPWGHTYTDTFASPLSAAIHPIPHSIPAPIIRSLYPGNAVPVPYAISNYL